MSKPTPNLGELPPVDAEKDAVHVAVAPVIAGEKLYPGQHIILVGGKAKATQTGIGIVDPYLTTPVNEDQPFWLFLYPNTITSLRHDWSHPAFPAKPNNQIPDGNVEESKRWLENLASDGRVSYEDLMVMAEDRHFVFGTEMYDYNTDENQRLFWHHYSVVTGNYVPHYIVENTYFGCSC